MSTSLTINGTSIASIGFVLKRIDGHIGVGQPKAQGTPNDPYTSQNVFLQTYRQESPIIEIEMFQKFETIAAAESALFTLYGILIQPGEHAFIHTDGLAALYFKGIMAKGVQVDAKKANAGLFFSIKLKITKTND